MAYNHPTTATGLSPNAFSAVGGGAVGNKIYTEYEILKPNEYLEVFNRHSRSRAPFRLMLRSMGFSRGVAAPTTGHYEYTWEKSLVTVGTITTPSTGPGTPVTFSLAASDMYNLNVNQNGVARQASYPIKGEEMLMPNGKLVHITAKDTTVTPHRITVTPKDGTLDLLNILTANSSYAIVTNSHAEGSGLPDGRTSRVIKYNNTFQTIKTISKATGDGLTNETYFNPLPGQPGSFVMKTDWDAVQRFEDACAGALLWGEQNTNAALIDTGTDTGYDVEISGTEGLMNFVNNDGFTDNYVTYSLADFEDIAEYYEGQRAGHRDLLCLSGFKLFRDIENVLQAFLNADASNNLWQNWMGAGECDPNDEMQPNVSERDWFFHIGFKGLHKIGYDFGLKLMHPFNEAVGAGAAAYDYTSQQVIIPKGYTKNRKTGQDTPTLGYEYKQLGNMKREMVYDTLSGAGIPNYRPSNQYDTRTKFWISQIAFHGTCANQTVIQKRA